VADGTEVDNSPVAESESGSSIEERAPGDEEDHTVVEEVPPPAMEENSSPDEEKPAPEASSKYVAGPRATS